MKNQKGMTLVEILVAMGLMVMVVFCFTPFMLSSLQNVQVAGEQRENLYTQKGDMEEQISEGIDYTTTGLEGVAVYFSQGSEPPVVGTANGLYLTSDLLTSFIASDEAELDISPGSVSENCPSSQVITITCDSMEFTDVNKFELKEGTSKANWPVKFTILDANHATMEAVGSYKFDMKYEYQICYDTVSADLRITPSSLIAVGQDGAYYVYTSEGKWKQGAGTATGSLGDITLRDAVWTGTQYVAAGDDGSWYYTEDVGGWQNKELGSNTDLTHLSTDDGQIYVSGTVTYRPVFITFYTEYQKVYTQASEAVEGNGVYLAQRFGEASVVAKFGTTKRVLWATYHDAFFDLYNDNQLYIGDKAVFDTNNHVGDIEFNGYAYGELDEAPEVIAVSETSGKIWHTLDGQTWTNNGDRKDTEKIPNAEKSPAYVYTYSIVDDQGENSTLTFTVKTTESDGQPGQVFENEQGEDCIEYEGKQYILSDVAACTIAQETYYEEGEITIGNNLNAVAFGELEESGDVWVAGGDATYKNDNRFTKDIVELSYRYIDGNWVKIAETEKTSEPDEDAGGSEGTVETTAKILWRNATDYDAGQWQVAEVPSNCPTINDIEFIGGKFYAVGDGDWIMVSENGKKWTQMNVINDLGKNLYGIAGWGDDWGTD